MAEHSKGAGPEGRRPKQRKTQTTQDPNYAGPELRRARTTQGPNGKSGNNELRPNSAEWISTNRVGAVTLTTPLGSTMAPCRNAT